MKLSLLHQSYLSRRSNSFRGSSWPLDSSSDAGTKSPSSLFWLVLHSVCCLISILLGFRFSRLIFFLLFSTTNLYTTPSAPQQLLTIPNTLHLSSSQNPPRLNETVLTSSSRVVVGRHGIRIRPWPHPNPTELMKAHRIMERVQREQRAQFGIRNPKTIIAVTTTYVRTFQTLHLTGVVHSLMLVPYDVVWIVVEAGGVTNETANMVAKSGVRSIHIGFGRKKPNTWLDRFDLETKMRIRALRVVREKKLDGIVMFADDSNMHSMELFDEIQNVRWFGAVSVGILLHSGGADESLLANFETAQQGLPVQGPACNTSNKLAGWYTFDLKPFEGKSAVLIGDRGPVLPRKLEWAEFVLNSRLLWKEADDNPDWVKDFDELGEDIDSPLSLLKDASKVEPLGNCGKQILLWWLRVEARSDSKFPPGWIIDPPLEITVPSKRTPWPDAPPELPSLGKASDSFPEHAVEKVSNSFPDHTVEHSTKTRTSRKHSSRKKRKHETKVLDTQVPIEIPKEAEIQDVHSHTTYFM